VKKEVFEIAKFGAKQSWRFLGNAKELGKTVGGARRAWQGKATMYI